LKLKKILAETLDVKDSDLRAAAYKYNRAHGVPISREERNCLIVDLYFKDGKTQQQIKDLMGLSIGLVNEIIDNFKSENPDIYGKTADKRRKLTDEDWVRIARLILAGENQEKVAKNFGVAQSTISEGWSKFRDRVHKLYTEEKLLKREVAEKVGLTTDEVDRTIATYENDENSRIPITENLR